MPELCSQRQRLFSKRRQTNERGLAARRCRPPRPPTSPRRVFSARSRRRGSMASSRGSSGRSSRFSSGIENATAGLSGARFPPPLFANELRPRCLPRGPPVRILTVLDEKGQPLATPAGPTRDWRRPFVSQEIGEPLPRWEVASYLTDPGSISAQARSASAVIWILVLILFVSVAGGGTMVLTSVYGEMRMAQKKATFVANVSHELKTPLTSISLFVDLLRRKPPPDPAEAGPLPCPDGGGNRTPGPADQQRP